MRCNGCAREIRTRQMYLLVIGGERFSVSGSFCALCWDASVTPTATRRLRSKMQIAVGDSALAAEVWTQPPLPEWRGP
jgi:hypothetical protein